jgi:Ca2+-binding RTX toxin-like protein
MNPLTNPLLAQSLAQVTATLQYFAYQPNFLEQLRVTFGDDFDSSVALGIRQLFQSGDFSLIPDLQILSNGELGSANGAYAGDLDEIFVSSDFLAQRQGDVAAIANLLLEEFGHKLDRLLNGNVDSPGDEGAIFAALAQGQTLSTDELAQLRAEDDHRTISVDGRAVAIEMEDWTGTSGPDNHTGRDSSNSLSGRAGNDYLKGNTGDDTINGGFDSDSLYGLDGNDRLYGDADNDILLGGNGDDTLIGGKGKDTLIGGAGNDYLDGSLGNDIYIFNTEIDISADIIDENEGLPIDLGNGIDTLDFSNYDLPIEVDLTNTGIQEVAPNLDLTISGGGIENVVGSPGDDTIFGNELENTLDGMTGDDYLVGVESNDILYGRNGNDVLDGGDGSDTLIGGTGNDNYIFNADTDTGIDIVDETAGDGIDTLTFSATTTQSINVDLNSPTVQFVTSNLQITLNGLIENVIGGSSFDKIFGNSLANNISGGDSSDYLYGDAGNDTLNGGTGIDELIGRTGDDTLNGDADDDRLNGGVGNDILAGGTGNDKYIFNAVIDLGADIVDETGDGIDTLDFSTTSQTIYVDLSSADIQTVAPDFQITLNGSIENVFGGSGNDLIFGNSLDNNLNGRGGNDAIYGDAGNDEISGSAGNDYLYGDAGNDYLYGDADDDNLNGGTGNDTLNGGTGDDTLNGGIGNDTLYGDAGSDTLRGGAGNDTYIFNAASTSFKFIDEFSSGGNDGIDTLDFRSTTQSINIDLSRITVQSPASNLQILTISGSIENVAGGSGTDSIYGNSLDNTLDGGAGGDYLSGGAGNDLLSGGADSDLIYGDAGNDTLNGGIGDDFLYDYGGGNDLIIGGAGNDILDGGVGNDTLTGDTGNDTLSGGAGNDTYIFNAATDNGYDIVDETSGDGIDTLDFSTTTTQDINIDLSRTTIQTVVPDLLQLNIDYDIENVTGGGGNDNIFGNNLDNSLSGGAGNDYIDGGDGNDILRGGDGNNTLDGGTGNDVLFSSLTGKDTLTGGLGDDVYEIHNINDIINETAGGGIDTIWTDTSYTMSANIENMYLVGDINGTGNAGDNTIVAYRTGTHVLDGAGGNDNLIAGTGDDTLIGGDGDDLLWAGTGTDSLEGGVGNDVLYSSLTGLSTLAGGAGNDVYEIHRGDDTIVEIAGEGIDTIWTDTSYTMSANVENMYLVGSINGTGNDSDNTIVAYESGTHTLDGAGGNDNLIAGTGDDTLIGGDGDDLLWAGSGTDSLSGGAGNDVLYSSLTGLSTLAGGAGNDVYEIHRSDDTIVENPGEGIDTIWTDTSYTMSANVENMYLVGSINGTGNAGDNTIVGYGVGNNTINGGAGNDLLYGGAGNDTFIFDSSSFLAQVISGVDTIGDFTVNQDKIQLSKAAFSALTTVAGNPLAAADFGTVTTTDLDAGTLGRAIVYNGANGKLFYDTNGAAAGFGTNGGQFAQLATGLDLHGTDFTVVSNSLI